MSQRKTFTKDTICDDLHDELYYYPKTTKKLMRTHSIFTPQAPRTRNNNTEEKPEEPGFIKTYFSCGKQR